MKEHVFCDMLSRLWHWYTANHY